MTKHFIFTGFFSCFFDYLKQFVFIASFLGPYYILLCGVGLLQGVKGGGVVTLLLEDWDEFPADDWGVFHFITDLCVLCVSNNLFLPFTIITVIFLPIINNIRCSTKVLKHAFYNFVWFFLNWSDQNHT